MGFSGCGQSTGAGMAGTGRNSLRLPKGRPDRPPRDCGPTGARKTQRAEFRAARSTDRRLAGWQRGSAALIVSTPPSGNRRDHARRRSADMGKPHAEQLRGRAWRSRRCGVWRPGEGRRDELCDRLPLQLGLDLSAVAPVHDRLLRLRLPAPRDPRFHRRRPQRADTDHRRRAVPRPRPNGPRCRRR